MVIHMNLCSCATRAAAGDALGRREKKEHVDLLRSIRRTASLIGLGMLERRVERLDRVHRRRPAGKVTIMIWAERVQIGAAARQRTV